MIEFNQGKTVNQSPDEIIKIMIIEKMNYLIGYMEEWEREESLNIQGNGYVNVKINLSGLYLLLMTSVELRYDEKYTEKDLEKDIESRVNKEIKRAIYYLFKQLYKLKITRVDLKERRIY